LAVRETVERLRVQSKVSVPDDVREMVELATHTDHLEARAQIYGARRIALWHRLYGKAMAETQQAIAGLVDRTRDYSAALINERGANPAWRRLCGRGSGRSVNFTLHGRTHQGAVY
jgi:hypothetical protein